MTIKVKINPSSQAVLNKIKKKNFSRFTQTATKLAANAAKRELIKNTPKRFTGKLRDSYAIRSTKDGYSVVVLGRRNQQAFASLDKGRKSVTPKKAKRLFIPTSKKGYNAAVRRSYSKSLKYGVDFVYAKKSKATKGKSLSFKAKNKAKQRFKERINLMAKEIFV